VLVNFTDGERRCPLPGTVEVASDGRGEGRPYANVLAPDAALLLRDG
jgi:alpha-glucosidase